MQIDAELKERAEEFRLRSGQPVTVLLPNGEYVLSGDSTVRHEELNTVIELATGGSVHSSAESMKNGFITVSGGHRIGICGTAVVKDGELTFIKDISSVSIRIAKEFPGVAESIVDEIMHDGKYHNTLIVSPPGFGKTTVLRDMIRLLSRRYRISVADERGEIAAKYKGVPQFDVGQHTDVMEGIGKAKAMMLMLRAMSPEILAVDEITAHEDIQAIEYASNCGVGLLATAHGDDAESLMRRPLYKKLLELNVFKFAVVLKKDGRSHTYKVYDLEDTGDVTKCSESLEL